METVLVEYGERQLHFDPDEHRYWLDSTELVSVTQYLKLAGYCHPYHGDGSAATRGRHVHTATLYLDHNRLDWSTLDPILVNRVKAWQQFKEAEQFTPDLLRSEKPCFHPIYLYAGTPDRPGRWRGDRPVTLELKTGEPEKWHLLQVGGGYQPMLASHEPTYAKADTAVVYLNEDGRYLPGRDLVLITDKKLPMLFASIVATVNGRDFYGNTNGRA